MADNQDLAIVIEAVNNASKKLKEVNNDLEELGSSSEKQGKQAEKSSSDFNKLVAAIGLGNLAATATTSAIRLLGDGIRSLNQFLKDSVSVASEYETVLKGLDSVAESYGFNIEEVRAASERLTEDGLLAPTEAAAALKNLLAGLSGVTVEQAEAMVMAMKDTASYSRVLDNYGESIIQTTKGIRNRNSLLTDSAGIQTNLSILLEKHGFTLQDLDKDSKKFAATQALINEYLKESEFAFGDSAEYASTFKGQLSLTNRAFLDLKDTIGNIIMPIVTVFANEIRGFIQEILSWVEENKKELRLFGEQVALTALKVIKSLKPILQSFISLTKIVGVATASFIAAKTAIITFGIAASGSLIPTITAAIIKFQAMATAAWAAAAGVIAAMGPVGWAAAAAALGAAILAIKNDFLGMTSGMKNAWGGFTDAFSTDTEDIRIDFEDNTDSMLEDYMDKLEDMEEGGEKYTDKQIKNMAKETLAYEKTVEDRVEAFERQFEDLVLKHRDKIKELTEDLEEENTEYKESLADLKDDFNEAMTDIEKRHEEKTESIKEDIEDERKKAEEEISKLTEAYNEENELIKREGKDRVDNLRTQLEREKALGQNANQEKIASIEEMIAREKEGLDQALEDKEGKHQREVDSITEKLNEKIAKIREELTAENQEYEEALENRKRQYDEEVQKAKNSYQEKRQALQSELDKEKEIREKYADDFDRLQDKVVEDDITRLVNKHEREMAELEEDHNEKLAKIKEQGYEQGSSYAQQFGDGLADGSTKIKQETNKIKQDLQSLKNIYEDYENKVTWMPGYAPWETGQNMSYAGGGGGGGAFAKGGLATQPSLAGEAGPEIVLPLNFPNRMANIMQSMGVNNGGDRQVVQHFHVNVNSKQDVDVVMERAAFAMQHQGGLN